MSFVLNPKSQSLNRNKLHHDVVLHIYMFYTHGVKCKKCLVFPDQKTNENSTLPCNVILALFHVHVHHNAVEENSGTSSLQCSSISFEVFLLSDKHTIYHIYEK